MEEKKNPQITIEYFEEVYIEHVTELLRITREELDSKLSDTSIHSLNKKAERFITTYLKNKVEGLTEENWAAAKELYIQWKLCEGIELEKESQDKKDTLLELLELFRSEVIALEEEEIESRRKTSGIVITKGRLNPFR